MTDDDDDAIFAARDHEPGTQPPLAPIHDITERRSQARLAELGIITRWGAIDDLRAMQKIGRYATPFPSLDAALGLGGWFGGNVYVLVGGTGVGKTTFMLACGRDFALRHGPVLYLTEEMRTGHCLTRAVAHRLGVSSNSLITGGHGVTDDELAAELPDRLFFMRRCGLDKVRQAVVTLRQMHDDVAPLVIVDYLGKLADQMLAADPHMDPRLATTMASSQLVAIAEQLASPILAVSAGGRSSNAKLRGRPGGRAQNPRDLPPSEFVDVAKESGAVEYDATALLTLSIGDELDVDGHQVATMTVAKARYGRAQHIAMSFDGAAGVWHDRGRVEPTKKAEDVDPSQLTADRIARISKIEQLVLTALAIAPQSMAALREQIKLARPDIELAVSRLMGAGAVVKSGSTKSCRYKLAETELPHTETGVS